MIVPMLKDDELVGAITIYRQEVRPFTDKQIELVHELRRPGRHRHRERATAQRVAPAHRRSHRIAGAADRDQRGAEGHLPARRANWSRCSRPCWRTPPGICDAKFGTLFRVDGERVSCAWQRTGNVPAALRRMSQRQRGAFRPEVSDRPGPHPADQSSGPHCRSDESTEPNSGQPQRCHVSAARASIVAVPMLKDNELVGAIVIYRTGGAALHRQADRAGAELRRAGGHRHREHAAAQRTAPAHRRSHRIAAAADRDRRRAQGHQPLGVRSAGGAQHAGGESAAQLCDANKAQSIVRPARTMAIIPLPATATRWNTMLT